MTKNSSRRIRALEALAERGATEGERKAAREALKKHRPSRPTASPSARVYFGFDVGTGDWTVVRAYTEPAPSPPSKPKPKAAHPIEPAHDNPQLRNVPRIEVATNAEMHERFRQDSPCSISWRGRVYDVESPAYSGFVIDRDVYPPRFHLLIYPSSMKLVS